MNAVKLGFPLQQVFSSIFDGVFVFVGNNVVFVGNNVRTFERAVNGLWSFKQDKISKYQIIPDPTLFATRSTELKTLAGLAEKSLYWAC